MEAPKGKWPCLTADIVETRLKDLASDGRDGAWRFNSSEEGEEGAVVESKFTYKLTYCCHIIL